MARELATHEHLALVCRTLRGIDERARALADRPVSIGDYVLTGGELPALVMIDAVARLVPGVIEEASSASDSFAAGLLEHPRYAAGGVPGRGRALDPAVGPPRRGGSLATTEALRRTLARRPDLLETAELDDDDRSWLAELRQPATD